MATETTEADVDRLMRTFTRNDDTLNKLYYDSQRDSVPTTTIGGGEHEIPALDHLAFEFIRGAYGDAFTLTEEEVNNATADVLKTKIQKQDAILRQLFGCSAAYKDAWESYYEQTRGRGRFPSIDEIFTLKHWMPPTPLTKAYNCDVVTPQALASSKLPPARPPARPPATRQFSNPAVVVDVSDESEQSSEDARGPPPAKRRKIVMDDDDADGDGNKNVQPPSVPPLDMSAFFASVMAGPPTVTTTTTSTSASAGVASAGVASAGAASAGAASAGAASAGAASAGAASAGAASAMFDSKKVAEQIVAADGGFAPYQVADDGGDNGDDGMEMAETLTLFNTTDDFDQLRAVRVVRKTLSDPATDVAAIEEEIAAARVAAVRPQAHSRRTYRDDALLAALERTKSYINEKIADGHDPVVFYWGLSYVEHSGSDDDDDDGGNEDDFSAQMFGKIGPFRSEKEAKEHYTALFPKEGADSAEQDALLEFVAESFAHRAFDTWCRAETDAFGTPEHLIRLETLGVGNPRGGRGSLRRFILAAVKWCPPLIRHFSRENDGGLPSNMTPLEFMRAHDNAVGHMVASHLVAFTLQQILPVRRKVVHGVCGSRRFDGNFDDDEDADEDDDDVSAGGGGGDNACAGVSVFVFQLPSANGPVAMDDDDWAVKVDKTMLALNRDVAAKDIKAMLQRLAAAAAAAIPISPTADRDEMDYTVVFRPSSEHLSEDPFDNGDDDVEDDGDDGRHGGHIHYDFNVVNTKDDDRSVARQIARVMQRALDAGYAAPTSLSFTYNENLR